MIIKNAPFIIPAGPLTPHLPSAQPAHWSTESINHMQALRAAVSLISKENLPRETNTPSTHHPLWRLTIHISLLTWIFTFPFLCISLRIISYVTFNTAIQKNWKDTKHMEWISMVPRWGLLCWSFFSRTTVFTFVVVSQTSQLFLSLNWF